MAVSLIYRKMCQIDHIIMHVVVHSNTNIDMMNSEEVNVDHSGSGSGLVRGDRFPGIHVEPLEKTDMVA